MIFSVSSGNHNHQAALMKALRAHVQKLQQTFSHISAIKMRVKPFLDLKKGLTFRVYAELVLPNRILSAYSEGLGHLRPSIETVMKSLTKDLHTYAYVRMSRSQ